MKLCKLTECDKKYYALGYCEIHYGRFKRHGNPHTKKVGGFKHGLTDTKLYWRWRSIIQRVDDKNHPAYKDYGGRGISLCTGYRDFLNFWKDFGEPVGKMTLDRIDNNSGYWCGKCEECKENDRPKNVRWANQSVQSHNQRHTYGGKPKGISQRPNGKWRARITIDRKTKSLGEFETAKEAHEAWLLEHTLHLLRVAGHQGLTK